MAITNQLAFPKPQTQASRRRAKRNTRKALIASVRSAVMARDGKCRICKSRGSLQMHEVVFRSQGRSLEQTFTLMNCLALCVVCHFDVHARHVWLRFADEERGCNGEVIAERGDKTKWMELCESHFDGS